MSNHMVYRNTDFPPGTVLDDNKLANLVIEGGLSICKRCGAGERDLIDYPTCEEYLNSTMPGPLFASDELENDNNE